MSRCAGWSMRRAWCALLVGCVILGLAPGAGADVTAMVKEEWVVVYDGPCSGGDYPSDMALDSEGNVIITGSGDTTATNHDTVTVKYDPDGNELWVARYDDPYGEDVNFDRSFSVAVDSDDNVYIAGWARGATSTDYLTVAYGPDGDELWVATWDSPYQLFDWACDVVVDSDGRVYVVGTIWTSDEGEDIAIVCYDSSGELLWTDRYSGEDGVSDFPYTMGICEVEEARVFVVGYTNLVDYLRDSDGIVLAYDEDGGVLWEYYYEGIEDEWDGLNEIVFDSSGNGYVTGCTVADEGDQGDLLIMALDCSGEQMWMTTYDGGVDGLDTGYGIAIDASGNIYACGIANGDIPDDVYSDPYFATDAVVVACDADGEVLWTDTYEVGDLNNVFWDLVASDDGYLYVTGSVYAYSVADNSVITEIYDLDGNAVWFNEFHMADETGDNGGFIMLNEDGDFYILGCTYTDFYLTDMVVMKYHHFTEASDYVDEVKDVIEGLPASAFSKNAAQRASTLSSKLDAVAKMIDDGDYQDAIDKLEDDVIPKMDGVEEGNAKDWITDPDAQEELCGMLQELIDYMETLI